MEHRILSFPVRILGRALFFAFLATALLLLTGAAIFTLAGLGFSAIPAVVRTIWFLSSFVGGFLAARAAGSRRLLWGLATGLVYLLILLLLSLSFSEDSHGVMAGFWFPLLCLSGGGIGGVFS